MSGPSSPHDEEEVGAFADINITPLTDVILVLLIIFMVTSTAVVEQERAKAQGREAEGQLEVTLPAGGAAQEVTATPALVVRIDASGKIEAGATVLEPAQLLAHLTEWKRTHDGSAVMVEADEGAAHGKVVAVMEAARSAGFERLSIATTSARDPRHE